MASHRVRSGLAPGSFDSLAGRYNPTSLQDDFASRAEHVGIEDELDNALAAWGTSANDSEVRQALDAIAAIPVPPDLLKSLRLRLSHLLPRTSDPPWVLGRLQSFVAASRSPTALLALFERDSDALDTLLRVLGAGSRLSDQLITEPESFDLLRASGGADVPRACLVDEIVTELDMRFGDQPNDQWCRAVLRGVVGRERLRIAQAEFVGRSPIERIAGQLTVLAESIIESVAQHVRKRLAVEYGHPRTPDGQPGRFAVLGLGALGAGELSYDAPLDLMFVCDICGPTDGPGNLSAEDYFQRLAAEIIELVGDVYDVSTSNRALGEGGPLVVTVTEAQRHYQLAGRTWERLLHVKTRPIAGDSSLGDEFIESLRPWVYRKYLQRADLEGLHVLTRKFTRRIEEADGSAPAENPAASRSSQRQDLVPIDGRRVAGGIADIEAVIGLLQLLNAGELVELRAAAALEAIDALRRHDCLSLQEAMLLGDHYRLLRRYEHCCQANEITTTSADGSFQSPSLQRKMACAAWHLGFRVESRADAGVKDALAPVGDPDAMLEAIDQACRLNQKMIRHLLRDTGDEQMEVPIETELVLDPQPEEATIREAMARHAMRDPLLAMHDLQRLADEPVPFLSSRRCRHFLATIAPQLLAEIGRTPDPHATLSTLVEVSDSLGGKAALWELFRAAPPTMHLVVRLCACSPYLTQILVRHPGMIDELVDSLLLDRLPSQSWLDASSIELCRAAEEIAPIVLSFKNGAHLQIGVRDVLGKESLEATHAALASTAESVLRRIAEHAERELTERYGDPIDEAGEPIELVMIAIGKLGGREPNYHSDLDVTFAYTADGRTRRRVGGHRTTTTAPHFFHELAAQILHRVNQPTGITRLYELGSSLSVSGSTSSPAPISVSLNLLDSYFRRGSANLWQYLALCKARAISGLPATRRRVDQALQSILMSTEWYPMMAGQVRELRLAMQRSATQDNLKRAAGGTVDVELITQTLQLRHASKHPEILVQGTTEALARLEQSGLMDPVVAAALTNNYRTLREIESKLRLLNTPQRHELPEDEASLRLLAYLMHVSDPNEIADRCREVRLSNRRLFDQLLEELAR